MEIARRTAEAAGRDLGEYDPPSVLKTEDGWKVFFKGKRRAVGDHFSVAIDGGTATARIIPGR